MTRRLLLVVLALASLGLAACGEKHETVTVGESEAVYVTLGEMQYQVQISRQLNPREVRDRAYLVGVPPEDRGLDPDQIWFAVFVRVFNGSSDSAPAADEFRIVDTRGREYEPIDLQNVNVFAYRPVPVQAGGQYPLPGSAQAETSSTGALLLFKLPVDALSFRPLELDFGSSQLGASRSVIRLDV